VIGCSRCGEPVDPTMVAAQPPVPCAGCGSPLSVELFPSMLKAIPVGTPATQVSSDDEASCFLHHGSRAEVPCDGCGRYLCSVCDIEIDGHHLCPTCVETGRGLEPDRMVQERVLWDSIVLTLAGLPVLLCWYFTILTAPVALVLGIRHRRSPASLVRGRARLYIGMTLAALEILVWATIAIVAVIALTTAGR
jgi:hypothetical protein